jgi:plastocyanin
MPTLKQHRLIPIVVLALTAPPIAVVAAGTAGAAGTKTVTVKNIRYSPANLTISKGTTVRWVWRDGSIRHDVRFRSGGHKPSRLMTSGSYRLAFNKRGTFRYFCSVHGEMKGRIVVK